MLNYFLFLSLGFYILEIICMYGVIMCLFVNYGYSFYLVLVVFFLIGYIRRKENEKRGCVESVEWCIRYERKVGWNDYEVWLN